MSIWLRKRGKNVTLPFEPLALMGLVGVAIAVLIASPTLTLVLCAALLFCGLTFFTVAKLSVIWGGRLVSFGPGSMSRSMRVCYFTGYVLLALGTILTLMFLMVLSAVR